MDTVSQAALGVFTTDTLCRRALGPKNIAIGMAAGILPDLDVLLPQFVELTGGNFYLSYLATHRTWSHSLVMAPFLALFLGALCKRVSTFRHLKFLPILWAAWLALVTHIVLDLCTSYGIELWWPLSQQRFAFCWVPEIDIFFLPLLVIILLLVMAQNARKRNSWKVSWIGLAVFVCYITFGAVMHQVIYQRVTHTRINLETAPLSDGTRLGIFPHLGSLFVWRVVEISDDRLEIARFDLWRSQPSEVHEEPNQSNEIPEWLLASPEYAIMRHATRAFLWVQRDSSAAVRERFLLQDVRYALAPADPNGLIAIAAGRDSTGIEHYEVNSWFLGKTFLGRQSYAQATAQLWQNIFAP